MIERPRPNYTGEELDQILVDGWENPQTEEQKEQAAKRIKQLLSLQHADDQMEKEILEGQLSLIEDNYEHRDIPREVETTKRVH